jgi:type 1 fimbria pilin
MKMMSVIFAVAAISGSVFAADIILKDGRVLKDATIKSQAPCTITVRHAGGLSSVA